MRARSVALVAAALAAVVLTDGLAAASELGAGAYVDGSGSPTAEASDGTSASGGRGGGASDEDPPCAWRVLISDDRVVAVFDADGDRVFSETGRWLAYVCDGDDLLSPVGGTLEPEGGLVDPVALAEQARRAARIANPAIHTSPDSGRRLYTQVATWLWVDDSWWQPYTVTVTAGRVTTTLTAVPTRAVWDTGDGAQATCDGPGVPWARGMRDEETYCKHTYQHSSSRNDTGTFPLRVTIEFSVEWSSNVGTAGALPGVNRTASTEVEVGEIQAIEG